MFIILLAGKRNYVSAIQNTLMAYTLLFLVNVALSSTILLYRSLLKWPERPPYCQMFSNWSSWSCETIIVKYHEKSLFPTVKFLGMGTLGLGNMQSSSLGFFPNLWSFRRLMNKWLNWVGFTAHKASYLIPILFLQPTHCEVPKAIFICLNCQKN